MNCKLIEGYPNYQICENGHVYNVKRSKLIKPLVNPTTGYCTIGLRTDSVRTGHYNHHLVAKYFLPAAPGADMQIDHQDGNKKNNAKGNLQWLTKRANIRKSIDKTKTTSQYFGVTQAKDGVWIAQIYTSGKRDKVYIGRYKTEFEAAQAYNEEAVKYHLEPNQLA